MKKWNVGGGIHAGGYVGEYEAETAQEAIELVIVRNPGVETGNADVIVTNDSDSEVVAAIKRLATAEVTP